MRRGVVLFCIGWIACGASGAPLPPNDHLAFGMTPDEVARRYPASMVLLSERRGSALYMVHAGAGVPGFYPVEKKVFLQFRHGRLTGWKRDWRMDPWTPF